MFELDFSLWLFKYQNDGHRNIIARIHWVPVWDKVDYNMGLCLVCTYKPPFTMIVSSLLVLTSTRQFFYTYSNCPTCADFFWTNSCIFFCHDLYICLYYFLFFIHSLSFVFYMYFLCLADYFNHALNSIQQWVIVVPLRHCWLYGAILGKKCRTKPPQKTWWL